MRDDALHESSQPLRGARGAPSGRPRGASPPPRDGRSGGARTSPAHPPPAPLRPPSGGADSQNPQGPAGQTTDRQDPQDSADHTTCRQDTQGRTGHTTGHQDIQGRTGHTTGHQDTQGCAEVRGAVRAPAGLRGRGARARPARAAAERLRGGHRSGRAPRRDGPSRPLRRGSSLERHAPAARGELTEPPTHPTLRAGSCTPAVRVEYVYCAHAEPLPPRWRRAGDPLRTVRGSRGRIGLWRP
jgi:hypothetical protein